MRWLSVETTRDRFSARTRVLLSAYACRAGHGSEPATGWGWACALSAAGHDVTVVTHPVGREQSAAWLRDHPGISITFEYVQDGRVGTLARRLGGQGPQWLAYLAWQRRAYRRSRALHARHPFDVAHHVTFGTIVPGSPFWRLGPPFVFGPIASGQTAPPESAPLFGHRWLVERLRTMIVRATRLNPLARSVARRAAVVLTPNRETAGLLHSMGARRVELMCDTGVDPALLHCTMKRKRVQGGPQCRRLRVIWIGSLVPRKGITLAIDAFAQTTGRVDAELHVVGDGPLAGRVLEAIALRGVGDRVVMHGRVAWDEGQGLLASADVMLFTSVRESFGSQVVEGAAAGLPLVTIDLHGVAALVPSAAAIKVPYSTLDETTEALGDGLVAVLSDEERRKDMSRAALRFGAQESWPRRAARMTQIYQSVCAS